MKETALYSNRVWYNQQLQPATIFLAKDKISKVLLGEKIAGANDYGNHIIMPGVIDVHVHINEPGRTDWEGFETATKAAARGGITTLVDMPLNSSPVVINTNAFVAKLEATQGKLAVNCGFWAGAIDANITDTIALLKKGCLGVKVFLSHSGIDEFPNISLADLDQLMAALKAYKVPILAHCELDTLVADTDLANNPTNYIEYLKSRPKHWEDEAIKAFITLGAKNDCPIHIVHLSSADSLNQIIEAKKTNPKLSVETCPHYLLFHAEAIDNENTLYKCAPPIREYTNNQQLKAALKTGIIDFITTDHSPAPPAIKAIESGNLKEAWGGIAGLQFLLSASWTALRDQINLNTFIPLLTSKPARFLGLSKQIGHIEAGFQADITIWNPDTVFNVTKEIIEHRHKDTPYLGHTLYGTVQEVFVNGALTFSFNQFVNLKAGKPILRNKN